MDYEQEGKGMAQANTSSNANDRETTLKNHKEKADTSSNANDGETTLKNHKEKADASSNANDGETTLKNHKEKADTSSNANDGETTLKNTEEKAYASSNANDGETALKNHEEKDAEEDEADADTSDELDELHATILSMCSDKPAKSPDDTLELNSCTVIDAAGEPGKRKDETEEEKLANSILAEDFSFGGKSFSLSPIKKTSDNMGKEDLEFDCGQFSLFSPAMTYSASYKTPLLKKYPSRYIQAQSTPVNTRSHTCNNPFNARAQSTPISALGRGGLLTKEGRKRKVETQTLPVIEEADADIKELSFEDLLLEVTILCGGKFEFNKELPAHPKPGDKELALNLNAENVSRINLDSIISQTDESAKQAEAETVAVAEDKGPGRFSGLQTSTRHTFNYSVEDEDDLDISEDILGLDDYDCSDEEIDEKTLLSEDEETVVLDKTVITATKKEEGKEDTLQREEIVKAEKDLEVSETYDSEAGIEQGSDDEDNEDDDFIIIDSILPSSDLDTDTSSEIKVSAKKGKTVSGILSAAAKNRSETVVTASSVDGMATTVKGSSEDTVSASAANKTTTVPIDMSLDSILKGKDEFEFDMNREICDVFNFLESEGFTSSDNDEDKTKISKARAVGEVDKEKKVFNLSTKGKAIENKAINLPTETEQSTSKRPVAEDKLKEQKIVEKKPDLNGTKSQPSQPTILVVSQPLQPILTLSQPILANSQPSHTISSTHHPPTVTVAPLQLDHNKRNDDDLDGRNNNRGAGMRREQTHFDYKAERDFLKNESPLMNEVMRKWGVKGIQNPDTNLTCATRYRKRNNGARRGKLEGFQICTIEQRSRNDGCRSPSTKRSRSSNYMNDINNLKTQLSEISHAAGNKADAMVRKRDQEMDKLRNHHGRRVRNLHLQQEMEVRNLHSDRMMSQYMKQTCLMQLRIEHMNQQDNLKAIYHKEMDRIVEHHREKFDEESENFQHRREQISCLIEQLKSKGDQPGAIDEQFGPHVNTSLIKAPCRANNNTKSLVTVCLPANIATSILKEDEVYNSFYNYE